MRVDGVRREVRFKMAANLSKSALGSCINGHIDKEDEDFPLGSDTPEEKVAILDAGAQYGKVRSLESFAKIFTQ